MPPYTPQIKGIKRNKRFESDLKKLQPDLLAAVKEAIEDLYKVPVPTVRRLHSLSGFRNPKVFTIDVLSNHSYKISLEIDNGVATLRRVASHKEIDGCP